MSDLIDVAHQAQRDLNSHQAKQGVGHQSISTDESGVNENVTRDFPGAEVRYGEMANHGGSGNKKIPPQEGGDYDARGRMTKAKDFEGPGGPEDKMKIVEERRPGDDGVPVRRTNY
ncbi:uncharacterized protein BHQ10_007296 [Talaromyces amestolkiae]|uniref:Uncharacterized protein n=1 Tax=Talaromyces amestolkiae TaxID=1196081 RepID=A0A364L656_TALAM|nr:uncharacterized protein BHQ10_007296 [Talaromyces amestolkiae]RAO71284.1 hypothetical protein BHQ10_007296 [Talaromyces amestolkiae]